MTQGTQTGALYQPRGLGWERKWGTKFMREGTWVFLWLIYVGG